MDLTNMAASSGYRCNGEKNFSVRLKALLWTQPIISYLSIPTPMARVSVFGDESPRGAT